MKANDTFYRNMTGNQLQAAFKEIEANLKYDDSTGMAVEKELIQNVANERGVILGNSFDAVKGYVEYATGSTRLQRSIEALKSEFYAAGEEYKTTQDKSLVTQISALTSAINILEEYEYDKRITNILDVL